MKKILLITGIFIGALSITNAQVTTAMDFTMTDCNSTTHSLFTDYLDNEEIVIIELFMNCGSCIAAGQKLDPMFMGLTAEHPGQVNFFAIAYNNSYTCSTVNSWVNANTPNAVPFDSGAAQISYYGGFGMPTVVVLGGSQHQVLYNSQTDGPAGDTATIHSIINNFFVTMGTENVNNNIQFSAYPNPVANTLNLELNVTNPALTNIQMMDVMGKVVKEISNTELSSGTHQLQVETSDLPNGMYFVRINSNGKTTQHKISVKH
jgi:hypothetical protein